MKRDPHARCKTQARRLEAAHELIRRLDDEGDMLRADRDRVRAERDWIWAECDRYIARVRLLEARLDAVREAAK